MNRQDITCRAIVAFGQRYSRTRLIEFRSLTVELDVAHDDVIIRAFVPEIAPNPLVIAVYNYRVSRRLTCTRWDEYHNDV